MATIYRAYKSAYDSEVYVSEYIGTCSNEMAMKHIHFLNEIRSTDDKDRSVEYLFVSTDLTESEFYETDI